MKLAGLDALEEGQRVRADANRVHLSLPKVGGQLSCHGVRLQRILWAILDATGHRPFVTEIGEGEIEIGSSFYGEGMLTLRVPRAAIRASDCSKRETAAKSPRARNNQPTPKGLR